MEPSTDKQLLQSIYNNLQGAAFIIESHETLGVNTAIVLDNYICAAHCSSQELKNRLTGNPPKKVLP